MPADIFTLFARDQILIPSDGQAYETALLRWSETAIRRAAYVVYPNNSSDVSKAIKYAVENKLDLAIKCGGHSCSGASSSSGGLVIDLGRMNACTVDLPNKTIKVGGGALWAEVDAEAAKWGMATVGGTVNHTGVGGLITGGGYGWLTPRYGLVIDILLEAEVVTTNGEILTCNEMENTDLFWGIRGAGSNFGPVTSFTLKLFPQPNPIWSGLLVYSPSKLRQLFEAVAEFTKRPSPDASMMVHMACPPPAYIPMLVVTPFFNGSEEDGRKHFGNILAVGPEKDMTRSMPYSEVNALHNPIASHGDRKLFKSTAFTSVNPDRMEHLFQEFVKLTDELPDARLGSIIVELHPFDKVVSVPIPATAFANRGRWYNLTCALRWKDPKLDKRLRQWSSEQVDYIRQAEAQEQGTQFIGRRGYGNYGLGDEKIREVFGENFERLQALKGRYDPDNVFHKWFAIPPKTS